MSASILRFIAMALAITAAPSFVSSAPLSSCYSELPQKRPAVSPPKFEPVRFTIKGISFTTKPSACIASDKFITRVRIENPFLGATVFDPRWPFEGTLPNPEGWYVSPDQKWRNIIGHQVENLARVLRDPEKALETLLTQEFIDRQPLGDLRQIYIRCVTEKWRGAHPSCRASIYWPQDGLGIGMNFLKEGLPHWDQMAEATRRKIIEWRD